MDASFYLQKNPLALREVLREAVFFMVQEYRIFPLRW